MDLLSWDNPMATESNLIPSSSPLHASLLAETGNKRETMDESVHIHHFFWRGKPQNLWAFSQRPKLTNGKHAKAKPMLTESIIVLSG